MGNNLSNKTQENDNLVSRNEHKNIIELKIPYPSPKVRPFYFQISSFEIDKSNLVMYAFGDFPGILMLDLESQKSIGFLGKNKQIKKMCLLKEQKLLLLGTHSNKLEVWEVFPKTPRFRSVSKVINTQKTSWKSLTSMDYETIFFVEMENLENIFICCIKDYKLIILFVEKISLFSASKNFRMGFALSNLLFFYHNSYDMIFKVNFVSKKKTHFIKQSSKVWGNKLSIRHEKKWRYYYAQSYCDLKVVNKFTNKIAKTLNLNDGPIKEHNNYFNICFFPRIMFYDNKGIIYIFDTQKEEVIQRVDLSYFFHIRQMEYLHNEEWLVSTGFSKYHQETLFISKFPIKLK